MKRLLRRYFGDNSLRDLKTMIVASLLMSSSMVYPAPPCPTQPCDKSSAWAIKAAIRYDCGNTILKLLQPINFHRTSTAPTEQRYRRRGSNNTCVEFQTLFWYKVFACFGNPTAQDSLVETTLIWYFQYRELSICTPRDFVFFNCIKLILTFKNVCFCLVEMSMECVFAIGKESLYPCRQVVRCLRSYHWTDATDCYHQHT